MIFQTHCFWWGRGFELMIQLHWLSPIQGSSLKHWPKYISSLTWEGAGVSDPGQAPVTRFHHDKL
jgi:hypothetical protein